MQAGASSSLEEIPKKVLKDLKITFVKDVDEVIKLSF